MSKRTHSFTPDDAPFSFNSFFQDPKGSKRKRVTRACDECHKKKVKCDGKQPCLHCSVYSYPCTYNKPTKRKISALNQFKSTIEMQMNNVRAVLNLLMPKVNVFDEEFNLEEFQEVCKDLKTDQNKFLKKLQTEYKRRNGDDDNDNDDNDNDNDDDEEEGEEVGEGARGNPKKKRRLEEISIATDDTPSTFCLSSPDADMSVGSHNPLKYAKEIKIILPPKEIAIDIVQSVWGYSGALTFFSFTHRPTFMSELESLYTTDPEEYDDKQNKILPLVYATMAVGFLLSANKRKYNYSKNNDEKDMVDNTEGYKYFVAAKSLIDIADARDIYGIQTIVMMIVFLQCSAQLATCYSYIGIALRIALREGLHKKIDEKNTNLSLIDIEVRKRLFWTIRKMDLYVNSILGLPNALGEGDFDQVLPVELEDEDITPTRYIYENTINPNFVSKAALTNAHSDIITILSHTISQVYPQSTIKTSFYQVPHLTVSKLEAELHNWTTNLPITLQPGAITSPEYFKANKLLNISYCHVRIILYRPFLQYTSLKHPTNDFLAKGYGESCLKASRDAVELAQQLHLENKLDGNYWFSIYTLFYAVASLVYFIHENQGLVDNNGKDYEMIRMLKDVRREADIGRKILIILKTSSGAAQRIHNILNVMFDKLNKRSIKLGRWKESSTSNSNAGLNLNNNDSNDSPSRKSSLDENIIGANLGLSLSNNGSGIGYDNIMNHESDISLSNVLKFLWPQGMPDSTSHLQLQEPLVSTGPIASSSTSSSNPIVDPMAQFTLPVNALTNTHMGMTSLHGVSIINNNHQHLNNPFPSTPEACEAIAPSWDEFLSCMKT